MENEMDVQAELEQLRLSVQAAQDEVMLAVMFHENWKPAAYDVARTVTSNSPTCGRLNSPRQDGQIMNRPSQKQQAWWRLL